MTNGVFVIKNRGIPCKGCKAIHPYITGQSDKGCTVPMGFSQEVAQSVAKTLGLPEDNVVLAPDTELVMLHESARKLPRPTDTHINLAQEVVRHA